VTFSVVIPAYNAARTVSSAITSVFRQTVANLEVIVVDDGSSDDTGGVAAAIQDPRLRVVSQSNRGLPAARNAGIAEARGQYVTFLDSDDLLLPRYLELSREALERTVNPGFAYTDAYVFDAVSGKLRERSAMARSNPPTPAPDDPGEFLAMLMRSNFVYVSTTVPRRVLDDAGGFDERLTSSEDYDLWLRILVAGYRAAWVPGRHALYRKHPGQMSKNLVTMARNLATVYDGVPDAALPTEAHRRLLARRRRSARLQARYVAPVIRRVPLELIATIKRAGAGESWHETTPHEVAEAYPDLTEV
jgi:GT2 family glycosyltransferase